MKCRSCRGELFHQVIDLGFAPPSNSYLTKKQLSQPEKHFPLRVLVCKDCWLVQTEDFLGREEVFDSEYHYLSSTSSHWVEHSRNFAISIMEEIDLNRSSFVVEVASNDGYLLQHFKKLGIPCLGVEPTASTAHFAISKGIETIIEFFGRDLAAGIVSKRNKADLIVGNNVFAHVPDLNDFVEGIEILLSTNGVCTLEFPHLLSLLQLGQFDTIYHEHFSYLSLLAVIPLLERHGLRIFKVRKLSTHGGSLRIYVCRFESSITTDMSVESVYSEEVSFGLNSPSIYTQLGSKAESMKNDLLNFLLIEKKCGRKVAGYGAAAKGNTFLNYAGIKSDLITFIVDAAESKQNKFMPGSHIPILHPNALKEMAPESVLILPWNIAPEVVELNQDLIKAGSSFYVAVPKLRKI